jgi:hypothetical protein
MPLDPAHCVTRRAGATGQEKLFVVDCVTCFVSGRKTPQADPVRCLSDVGSRAGGWLRQQR